MGVDDVEYHSLHYRQGTWKTSQNDGVCICCRQASKESIEVDAGSGVGPHVDDIKPARPHQRGNVTPNAPGARELLVVVLPHATVDGGVVHHAEVRLRIGVRVGIHVLLCGAEVGEANGCEVLVEDLPTSEVESCLTTRNDLCSRSWDRGWTSKWARESGMALARGKAQTATCFQWARHSLAGF